MACKTRQTILGVDLISWCRLDNLANYLSHDNLVPSAHDNLVTSVRYDWIKEQQTLHNHIFPDIIESSDAVSQHSLSQNKESLSAWLTAVLLLTNDFHLSSTEFGDALCLRYMKLLL